jgi:hypothetical protein
MAIRHAASAVRVEFRACDEIMFSTGEYTRATISWGKSASRTVKQLQHIYTSRHATARVCHCPTCCKIGVHIAIHSHHHHVYTVYDTSESQTQIQV